MEKRQKRQKVKKSGQDMRLQLFCLVAEMKLCQRGTNFRPWTMQWINGKLRYNRALHFTMSGNIMFFPSEGMLAELLVATAIKT